jgi:Transposase zinc-binding domain/Putative transposase
VSRPSLEVADIFRDHGPAWRRANAGHVSLGQLKVMSAIESCRTAALGGHVARCEKCAHSQISYNSCRNRHCPKCQGAIRWKDYRAEGRERQKVMTLATAEFIRRFLIHVLPHGFHRIRHYGLLASGTRADNIARARRLLDVPAPQPKTADATASSEPKPLSHPCPCCGGRMVIIETFERGSSPRYRPAASPAVIRIDTS